MCDPCLTGFPGIPAGDPLVCQEPCSSSCGPCGYGSCSSPSDPCCPTDCNPCGPSCAPSCNPCGPCPQTCLSIGYPSPFIPGGCNINCTTGGCPSPCSPSGCSSPCGTKCSQSSCPPAKRCYHRCFRNKIAIPSTCCDTSKRNGLQLDCPVDDCCPRPCAITCPKPGCPPVKCVPETFRLRY